MARRHIPGNPYDSSRRPDDGDSSGHARRWRRLHDDVVKRIEANSPTGKVRLRTMQSIYGYVNRHLPKGASRVGRPQTYNDLQAIARMLNRVSTDQAQRVINGIHRFMDAEGISLPDGGKPQKKTTRESGGRRRSGRRQRRLAYSR